MRYENWVDGALLDGLDAGSRTAIQKMAGIAADHVQALAVKAKAGHDDVTPWLVAALEAIRQGEDPNVAFRWKRTAIGRPSGSTALRDWRIRLSVVELMAASRKGRRRGLSLKQASDAVAAAQGGHVQLTCFQIRKICKGLKFNTDVPLPDAWML